MATKKKEPTAFIDVVDSDTRDSILRLNQKLSGLQVEMGVKLESLDRLNDEESRQQKQQLLTLSMEVDKALVGIQELTTMVISAEMTPKKFLKINHDALETFRETVVDKAQKLVKLSEGF